MSPSMISESQHQVSGQGRGCPAWGGSALHICHSVWDGAGSLGPSSVPKAMLS